MYLVFGNHDQGIMEFFGTYSGELEDVTADVVTLPMYLLRGNSFKAFKHDGADVWYIHVGSRPLIYGDGSFATEQEARDSLND